MSIDEPLWHRLEDDLPVMGRTVIVEGIVRCGRKKQLMAAKYMIGRWDRNYDRLPACFVALKEADAYTETIELRSVLRWRYAF